MNPARKMLTAALAAGALAASAIPIHDAVAGSSPPSDAFEFNVAKNARRIAGGVAVRIVFRVTCEPGVQVFEQTADVAQARPDGRIARGFAFNNELGVLCDGTPQRIPLTVTANEWAFTEGSALVQARMFACGPNVGPFGCLSFSQSKVIEIADPVERPSKVLPSGVVVVEGDDGSTQAEIPVRLDRASSGPITIDWTTDVGSGEVGIAEGGVDFDAGSGTLTFAPGEREKTIPVTVFGDTDVEEPALWGEWGTVSFSDPTGNAVLDTEPFFGLGLVIIIDDDAAPAP